MKEKDYSIETLRGIAVILLVSAHVIGFDRNSGMRVEDDSLYRYFYFSFEYIRMPLFTVISGFVYSLRPVMNGEITKLLKGKSRRVLIPLITVSSVQYIMHTLPGINSPKQLSDIWQIYFFSFDQFWFLQAIFLVFLTIAIIDSKAWINTPLKWLFVIGISTALCILFPWDIKFFSFKGYLYLLPFFILGCGIQRYSAVLFQKKYIYLASIIFLVGIILQQLLWFGKIDFITHNRAGVLSILVAMSGSVMLFRFRVHFSFLAKIGAYAYPIYLFHIFGTAGFRILLQKFNFYDLNLVFPCCLAAGFIIPIIADKICNRHFILRRGFLGLR